MNKLLDIAQSIGMFIAGIAIAYVTCRNELKKFFKKQKTNVTDALPVQSNIDVHLIERLEFTKELLNADIIHIYEFHNGEHYADGRSALKLSCTYEVTKAGINSIRKQCTQIPIAVLPKLVSTLLEKGKNKYPNVEDAKDMDLPTYLFVNSLGINSFVNYAIRNNENKIVGFIAVLWKDAKDYSDNERELLKLVYYIEENLISKI